MFGQGSEVRGVLGKWKKLRINNLSKKSQIQSSTNVRDSKTAEMGKKRAKLVKLKLNVKIINSRLR